MEAQKWWRLKQEKVQLHCRWRNYAGALFADACLKGLNGVPDVEECSYVQSTITELPFFASKVRLGKNGVEDVLDLGPLSDFEKEGWKH
ncbi:unnamed protein product [Brassica oleracea]|uniref:(rape) hypothetical protein n=1 Tax=Brassica napus TaxID=3708 RepID=A0A816Q7G0_BRANA|nr:unnamed protein product [Brassica napus]